MMSGVAGLFGKGLVSSRILTSRRWVWVVLGSTFITCRVGLTGFIDP